MKTAAELRQMEEKDLQQLDQTPLYCDKDIPPTEPPSCNNGSKMKNGRVDFGALGFFKIGAEEAFKVCNDSEPINNNSDIDRNTNENITENVSNAMELVDSPAAGGVELHHVEEQQTGESPGHGNQQHDGEAIVSSVEEGAFDNLAVVRADDHVAGLPGGVSNSTTVKKKKKEKTTKEARLCKKPLNKGRKAATIKKTFKQNTLTIKFKIHDIQQKAGKDPDFALFIKDNIHDPKALPPCPTASKYITYTKGSLSKKFFSKAGISYHRCPQDFFLCSNEIDFTENKNEVVRKAPKEKQVVQEIASDDSSDDSSDTSVGSHNSKSDTDSDVQGPKKVVFGFPQRDVSEEESDSSGGVNVYGRAAQRTISREKKAKKDARKKHAKDSASKTRVDILEKFKENAGQASRGKGGKGVRGGKGGKGGKGGRGRGFRK